MHIKINNLTKIYDSNKAVLNGVSFEIPPGLFGLIGRNGAGKTTLMRILATVATADRGDIEADGASLVKSGKFVTEGVRMYRSSLGYLPQTTKLMPYMNIVEFLDYVCVLKGIKSVSKREEETKKRIEMAGLNGEEKKRLGKYSGGMLRRAAIAQALINDPKMLIVDEPTNGLDAEERVYFLNMLSKIGVDRTVVFSTHIITDIEYICDNICVLDEGKIMFIGKRQTLIDSISGRLWEYVGEADEEKMLKNKAVITSVVYKDRKPFIRYVSESKIHESAVHTEPKLEDAYIHALGGVKRM